MGLCRHLDLSGVKHIFNSILWEYACGLYDDTFLFYMRARILTVNPNRQRRECCSRSVRERASSAARSSTGSSSGSRQNRGSAFDRLPDAPGLNCKMWITLTHSHKSGTRRDMSDSASALTFAGLLCGAEGSEGVHSGRSQGSPGPWSPARCSTCSCDTDCLEPLHRSTCPGAAFPSVSKPDHSVTMPLASSRSNMCVLVPW